MNNGKAELCILIFSKYHTLDIRFFGLCIELYILWLTKNPELSCIKINIDNLIIACVIYSSFKLYDSWLEEIYPKQKYKRVWEYVEEIKHFKLKEELFLRCTIIEDWKNIYNNYFYKDDYIMEIWSKIIELPHKTVQKNKILISDILC